MYILREDRKNRVKRSEKIKEYNRKKLLDSINERFKKMEKIKRDKQNLDTERKIMQEQMRQKKQKMMRKFNILIHSDKFYKREEFYDYIFNNKPMPNFALLKNTYDYIDLRKDGMIDMVEWTNAFGDMKGKLDAIKPKNKEVKRQLKKLRKWETSNDIIKKKKTFK